ncbi:MAG: ATP-binding protein [Bacillus thermozeamaize]|uniref:Iron-sulfur cluster carrier protein n=1 Tax=Bacillus thermozeamaize TaxID=230954 RepID=A0A1Y3PLK5_9BACI|nr:MAG: ATP-binding protein [Bacillus thermozeamaize]
MLTREQVLEVLKDVEDPELHKSVVELDMVRNIQISPENDVQLELVLTIQGCPLRAVIEERVTKALKERGARNVQLRIGAMTDEERAALAKRLREERAAQAGATSQPSVSPLLSKDSGTRFIAIASGKGGVGKSTVTVNLAVALARAGVRVGVIDADIYGFSVPDMMGIDQRPTVIDNLILPVQKLGVKVMSMAFFVEDNRPVIWRGPMLGKMLRNFFSEIHWGELDYMLLDLPPGTGDVALDVHQLIPQSKEIIVTTPHLTAAFVAARAGAMAIQTNHEIIGVVENMSWYECGHCGNRAFIFGQGGGQKLAETLRTKLLAQIPLGAPEGSGLDEAPGIYPAGSPQAKIFDQLAKEVIDRTAPAVKG